MQMPLCPTSDFELKKCPTSYLTTHYLYRKGKKTRIFKVTNQPPLCLDKNTTLVYNIILSLNDSTMFISFPLHRVFHPSSHGSWNEKLKKDNIQKKVKLDRTD